MVKTAIIKPLIISLVITTLMTSPPLWAASVEEDAGVAVGVTAGNMAFLPAKAAMIASGLTAGIFSFIVTGGNMEITKQIFENTVEGPYLITPAVARAGVGERPELEKE
jgi:hypothetical protein